MYTEKITGLAKKFVWFSPIGGCSCNQSSLTSFRTILVDCTWQLSHQCTLKKKLVKTGEFLCSHFNIKDGIKHNIFSILCFNFSRKTQLRRTKKLVQCVEKVLWQIEHVKVVCEVSCWRFLAGRCSSVGETSRSWQRSNQDINWEQSTLCHMGDSRHTEHIAKLIRLLAKMKNVAFILRKNHTAFLGQPNIKAILIKGFEAKRRAFE